MILQIILSAHPHPQISVGAVWNLYKSLSKKKNLFCEDNIIVKVWFGLGTKITLWFRYNKYSVMVLMVNNNEYAVKVMQQSFSCLKETYCLAVETGNKQRSVRTLLIVKVWCWLILFGLPLIPQLTQYPVSKTKQNITLCLVLNNNSAQYIHLNKATWA